VLRRLMSPGSGDQLPSFEELLPARADGVGGLPRAAPRNVLSAAWCKHRGQRPGHLRTLLSQTRVPCLFPVPQRSERRVGRDDGAERRRLGVVA
jgi:hypothetical protein